MGKTTWLRVSRAVTPVGARGPIMHINGGLVVNFKNTCAESKRSGAEKKVGTCCSCAVVGTARPFDLLCSGVTGLWQMVNLGVG